MYIIFTPGFVVVALILIQHCTWADQCTSTKCNGQGFERNSAEGKAQLDKCWGSSSDDTKYPFFCEEGYDVYDFSTSLKVSQYNDPSNWIFGPVLDEIVDFSYYTCCKAENTTTVVVNAPKCVDTVCSDYYRDCLVRNDGEESMTCDSDNFPYPNPTGASVYHKKRKLRLDHYVCCNMEISDIPPLIGDSSKIKNRDKIWQILMGTSGIISIISSATIIWMICRSKDGLSKASHRILIGMSISDIIFSLAFAHFGAAKPKEHENCLWNAHGTEESCFAFGVLWCFGTICGVYYSASLNVYYLLVVKYKRNVRKKVEPFLHLIPVFVGVSATIFLVVNESIDKVRCSPTLVPSNIITFTLINGLACIILFVALGMMHCTVRAQIKKMSKYGVGSLRASVRFIQDVVNERKKTQSQKVGWMKNPKLAVNSISSFLDDVRRERGKRRPEPNSLESYNKSILMKGKFYTLAYFVTYGPTLLAFSNYPVLVYFSAVLTPLQGFWNLVIFMYPKVMVAKNRSTSNNKITWRQAIVEAFSPSRKQQVNNVQNQVNRPPVANCDCNDVKTESTQRNSTNTSKKKSHEEEKTEIRDTEEVA